MKKYLSLVLVVLVMISFSCKKEKAKDPGNGEVTLSKKYAKYAINVYKDIDLKKRVATLSKAEPVDLLAVEKTVDAKKKEIEISKVKLSDNTIGFLKSKHIADKPIVFIEDTKIFIRNNTGSRVYTTIPRGTLAFIIEEKADWIKIYAGKINEKWITKQWAKDGWSGDENLIVDAKLYNAAISLLEKNPAKAVKQLKELVSSTSIFGVLADEKIKKLNGETVEDDDGLETFERTDIPDGKARYITTKAGLRMRKSPDSNGEKITVIPYKEKVEFIEEKGETITISNETGKWTQVKWNGNTGWVFGGFLSEIAQ